MSLFKKKHSDIPQISLEECVPVLRCSICTGEQVAGFRDRRTGHFREVTLIKTPKDLETFKKDYGVEDLIHLLVGLSHCQSANCIAVEIHFRDLLCVINPDVRVYRALIDAEEKLLSVDRIFEAVKPVHFILTSLKPSGRARDGSLYIVPFGVAGGTLEVWVE